MQDVHGANRPDKLVGNPCRPANLELSAYSARRLGTADSVYKTRYRKVDPVTLFQADFFQRRNVKIFGLALHIG